MTRLRITAFYPAEGTDMPRELFKQLVAERHTVATALGPFDYDNAVVERRYRGGLSAALQTVDGNLPHMSEPDRQKMCQLLSHLALVFISETGPEDDATIQWMGRLARQRQAKLLFVVPDAPEMGADGSPVHSNWLAGQIVRWEMADRATIVTAQRLVEVLSDKQGPLYTWLRTCLPVLSVPRDVTDATQWAPDEPPDRFDLS